MKIEIWSDIRCPFCYIGKRKLEAALEQFEHKDEVEVVWRSFQLDPAMKYEAGKSAIDYLAERRGQSRQWSVQVHQHVTQMAKEVGLTYNFDRAVIASSLDAHRLIQLAKTHNLGDEAEERLFKAYFTEGKDISNHATLIQLGTEIGLEAAAVEQMLNGDNFTAQVRSDQKQAQAIGVQGVPFFLINRQHSISGAQPSDTILQALQVAWQKQTLH